MPDLRIIRDGSAIPAFNMAADIYLFRQCRKVDSTVYLRVYNWSKPTLTLGYMEDNKLIENQKSENLSIIRRVTGGRSVLHWNDLTYSVTFSTKIKSMGETINETYSIISASLQRALEKVDIAVERFDRKLMPSNDKFKMKLPCFLLPNKNEILFEGKKLIGSAQKRGKSSVLQHGSIPLGKEFRRIVDYLKLDISSQNEMEKNLQSKAISLNEIKKELNFTIMESALVESFKETLSFNSFEQGWTKAEKKDIVKFVEGEEFKTKWNIL